jgi:GntR family transcriptional regulator
MYKMLEFTLDPKSGVPFYKQIILQIEMAIADGRLQNGDQLPTVRGLAVDLSLNPNTVARAYNELEIRGIVTTQQGSGTFISNKQIEITDVERERVLAELMRTCVSNASSYGFTVREIIDYLKEMDNNPSVDKGGEK